MSAEDPRPSERHSYPLSEFQEGQWWVEELDAIPKTFLGEKITVSMDLKRAVFVVHHLLQTVKEELDRRAAEAYDPELQGMLRRLDDDRAKFKGIPAAKFKGKQPMPKWDPPVPQAPSVQGEPIITIYKGPKNGWGAGYTIKWEDGIKSLPEGEHTLYAIASSQAEPSAAQPKPDWSDAYFLARLCHEARVTGHDGDYVEVLNFVRGVHSRLGADRPTDIEMEPYPPGEDEDEARRRAIAEGLARAQRKPGRH